MRPIQRARWLLPALAILTLGNVWKEDVWAQEGPRLPEGFRSTEVVRGLTGAVAMAVASDGRVFVCEQTGTLRVVKKNALLPTPFLSVTVDSFWERGLIGVALDPLFPERPYVYVNYVPPDPYPHHRISRFTAKGDQALPGSEVVLLEGDDQRKLGGSVPAGHQGGALRFGRDGKLYIGIGEQTAGAPSQKLNTFQGKILRINPDGSIPEDNPFYSLANGKYRAIWALGLRNPFCLAIQSTSGRMFINDVGGSLFEEINEGVAGANYGWPEAEGPSTNAAFRNPIHFYGRGVGKCITGGVFYNPARNQFPPEYSGKYFFSDFEDHWIKVLDPDRPKSSLPFATQLRRPVDLALAPDGSLYVLDRNAWVKDAKFEPGTGSLWRILFDPGAPGASGGPQATARPKPPASAALGITMNPDRLPSRLSELGLFRTLTPPEPVPSLIPYEVNVSQWADGALKRRWMALPEGRRIGFRPTGEWTLPPGSVLIEELSRERRLETRILVVDGAGGGFGAAYRWKADGTDAELVEDGETWAVEEGEKKRSWYSPGSLECLGCHSAPAGFVLGLSSRQLNLARCDDGENQIKNWARRGLFEKPLREEDLGRLSRLVSPRDASAPLAVRVRSYLDANCGGCHRPGGSGRGLLDARFDTSLGEQHLIDASLMAGDLGIREARTLVPGEPSRSVLFERMRRRGDPFKMPPTGSLEADPEMLKILAQWIDELRVRKPD
jgi:glucose/arabinose dehydrogenase